MSESEITIAYWAIRGIAAPLRMMTMFKGVKMYIVNYDYAENATKDGFDRSAWEIISKPALKEQHALMNLPYIIDNGLIVTQSHACMMYLGRKYGLLGKDLAEEVQCEQLLCEYMDFRNHVVDLAYDNGGDISAFIKKQTNASNGQLTKLNLWLERKYSSSFSSSSDPIFFVGDGATAPDFAIWEILDQFVAMAKFAGMASNPLESKLPYLFAFHVSFAQLPENARYLTSPLYALPTNGIAAKTYGATPSGAAWEFGVTEHTWRGSSGLY